RVGHLARTGSGQNARGRNLSRRHASASDVDVNRLNTALDGVLDGSHVTSNDRTRTDADARVRVSVNRDLAGAERHVGAQGFEVRQQSRDVASSCRASLKGEGRSEAEQVDSRSARGSRLERRRRTTIDSGDRKSTRLNSSHVKTSY